MSLMTVLSMVLVGMILITSQSPVAFAGFCEDFGPDEDCDGDGFTPNQGDCDDNNENVFPGQGCKHPVKEELGDKIDALRAQVQDSVEKNKDANKLTKKLDKVIKALNPPDNTEKNQAKLLKDTNKLLETEKISLEEHDILVTAIDNDDLEAMVTFLEGLELSDKDLKKLTKTIDKLIAGQSPDIGKACKELDGFINKTNKLFDKGKLTATDKDILIDGAQALKTSIECV